MPSALRRPAAVTTLGLMLLLIVAFLQVLQQAVRQGEARRRTTALQAEATWRCKALRDRVARDTCLGRLRAMPDDNAGLQQLLVAMTAADTAVRP